MIRNEILKGTIGKHNIKHGDLVNINTLKYIAAKENIELNDLMRILGISEYNRKRIRQSPSNNTKVYIFDKDKLKEIEVLIKSSVIGVKKVSGKMLDRLSKKYKINIKIVDKILNISKDQRYNLNRGQKYINLKSKVDEREVINEVFIDEVKYKEDVDKKEIDVWKRKYNLIDDEICTLLNVKKSNYRKLIQGKTKKMKIDLIDEYEKIEIEQKIIDRYKNQDYTTKEEILELKREIRTTDTLIRKTLSISASSYANLMSGKIKRVRIIFQDVKLKVDCIKMDIRYEHGEGNYSGAQLRKMCRNYGLDFDELLKNISGNINRYTYLKQALKENDDGIYIGEEHGLSDEFLKKYDEKLKSMCEKITRANCYFSHLNDEKSDIAQEAFILLLEKGGTIEKNYSYNKDLLFGLLGKKVKCFVIGKRNERYREVLLDNFDFCGKTYDEYNIFNENLEDFFVPLDERIKPIHRDLMQIFNDNKDYIYYHRENAYKVISYRLKISTEVIKQTVNEIQEMYIEYNFAKECKNGTVINMSDAIYF